MQLSAHLTFDGNCREAFEFYANVLGGRIVTMMTWGESPLAGHVSEAERSAIMHASLDIGAETLAGADAVRGPYVPMQGMYLILEPDDVAEAERIFAALAEGGNVGMPLVETFWAQRYGMVTDRFGVHWEVNCGKPH